MANRARTALWMLVIALIVRGVWAALVGGLTQPLNNYAYVITPQRDLLFLRPGLQPPGGYYLAWILYKLGGSTLLGYGLGYVILGSLIPLLIHRLAHRLFPGMDERQSTLAGWLAVFFLPLVFLSGTWRYMLAPVLFGLWHLDSLNRRGSLEAMVSGTLLILARPDFFLGGAVAIFALSRFDWRRKLLALIVPMVAVAIHHSVVPSAFNGPHNFWYNIDASLNERSRVAVIGYGPSEWHPELTLENFSADEATHRHRSLAFIREHPAAVLELLVMKTVRVFDVRRDGALLQGAIENVLYTAVLFVTLLAALLGLGSLGFAGARPGLLIIAGYLIPMVLVFSLDRSRILFQSLWLMPAASLLRLGFIALRERTFVSPFSEVRAPPAEVEISGE